MQRTHLPVSPAGRCGKAAGRGLRQVSGQGTEAGRVDAAPVLVGRVQTPLGIGEEDQPRRQVRHRFGHPTQAGARSPGEASSAKSRSISWSISFMAASQLVRFSYRVISSSRSVTSTLRSSFRNEGLDRLPGISTRLRPTDEMPSRCRRNWPPRHTVRWEPSRGAVLGHMMKPNGGRNRGGNFQISARREPRVVWSKPSTPAPLRSAVSDRQDRRPRPEGLAGVLVFHDQPDVVQQPGQKGVLEIGQARPCRDQAGADAHRHHMSPQRRPPVRP